MVEKFNISEKDELILLNYWRDNSEYSKVPSSLKNKITEQQSVELFSHYSDLGDYNKEIDNRIKDLEDKFEKQKEQKFFFIIRRELKEQIAKKIIWIFLGIVLGFLFSKFFF